MCMRALLLTSCGPETYHVIRGLVQPARPSDKTFEQLCALVQSHYSPKPSEIVERYKFHSRSRKPEESVSEYIAELRRLSEHCNFGNNLDSSLRDRIVCGINDPAIQKKLLSETNLDLKKTITVAVALEAATRDLGDLQRGNRAEEESVNYMKKQVSQLIK